MRFCLKCGEQLPDDCSLNSCPYCGQAMGKSKSQQKIRHSSERVKYCAYCGEQIPVSVSISQCPHCGKQIGKTEKSNNKNEFDFGTESNDYKQSHNYSHNQKRDTDNYTAYQSDNKTYYQQRKNFDNFSKKLMTSKKWLKIGVFLFLLGGAIFLTKFLFFNAPNKSYYKENMPELILNYGFYTNGEYEKYRSSIENIEIERRKTKNGFDDALCKITLNDAYLSRVVYIEFFSSRYNNGWYLDSWIEYQNGEFVPLKGMSETDILAYLEERGYSGYTALRDESNLQEKQILYYIDIDENTAYIESSGTIMLDGELGERIDEYSEEYPYVYSYYWDINADDSNVVNKWNIDGTYYCDEFYNGVNDCYDFVLTIKTTDDVVTWDYSCTIDEFVGFPVMDYRYVDHAMSGTAAFDEIEDGIITSMYNPMLILRIKDDVLGEIFTTIGFDKDSVFINPKSKNPVEMIKK